MEVGGSVWVGVLDDIKAITAQLGSSWLAWAELVNIFHSNAY